MGDADLPLKLADGCVPADDSTNPLEPENGGRSLLPATVTKQCSSVLYPYYN